jgi:putative toxin-antitoxin system antitoxin component (TIGR02293 family)
MPKVLISITTTQERALEKRIKEAVKGSFSGEIRKALNHYLAGPRGIETAFIKLLEDKAPKDLSAMFSRFKKTNAKIDRSLARLKGRLRLRRPFEKIDPIEVIQLALKTFGSTDKANTWFNQPNRALGRRTPLSLLTSQAGVKLVKTVLGRIALGLDNDKSAAGSLTKAPARSKETMPREIRQTIYQYLAGPKQVEAAFLKLLEEKAPKNLPALQAKLKKTNAKIDRTLARVKASERRMAALDAVDTAAVGRLALETFGSAERAYAWLQRPHKALGQRTPFSLLTSASGYTRVEALLKRTAHGVPCHGGTT